MQQSTEQPTHHIHGMIVIYCLEEQMLQTQTLTHLMIMDMEHTLQEQLQAEIYNINTILVGITSLAFAILLVLYSIKLLKYRKSVIQELAHPVKLSFFPSISISFLDIS